MATNATGNDGPTNATSLANATSTIDETLTTTSYATNGTSLSSTSATSEGSNATATSGDAPSTSDAPTSSSTAATQTTAEAPTASSLPSDTMSMPYAPSDTTSANESEWTPMTTSAPSLSSTTIVPPPPTTCTAAPTGTAHPLTTATNATETEVTNGGGGGAPGGGDDGLSSEARWLLAAAGIAVGILLIAIALCIAARWYCQGAKRRQRSIAKLRRREMADDELDAPPAPAPDLPMPDDDDDGEGNPHADAPMRDLALAGDGDTYGYGYGNEGGGGGRARGRGRGRGRAPPVAFSEVMDPADVLAPIDPRLFKSLYESDEDGAPLPHRREGSWMETDEDRRRRRERRRRALGGAAKGRFDAYLKDNGELIAAQQRALYAIGGPAEGAGKLKNIVDTDDLRLSGSRLSRGDSSAASDSDSSEEDITAPANMLPMSRAEAEQMRIEDLHSKQRQRRRIAEHFKSAHPFYGHRDAATVASKALLSTTVYRARAVLDDSVAAARERQHRETYAAVGNDVPWGNRGGGGPTADGDSDGEGGVAAVTKLQDLPWMTAARVNAIAKEHNRAERRQMRRQVAIAPYIQEDGRIDYDVADGSDGGGFEGSDGRPTLSDRASSFRGDRSSAAGGGGGRRRAGSERMSVVIKGSAYGGRSSHRDTASSLGRSSSFGHLRDLNGGNARHSALSADDLRRARAAFEVGSQRSNASTVAGRERESLQGRRRRASILRQERHSAHSYGHSDNGDGRASHRSVGDSDAGGSEAFGAEPDDGNSDDSDDDAVLFDQLGIGAGEHGEAMADLPRQTLVDARSLSLLRAQTRKGPSSPNRRGDGTTAEGIGGGGVSTGGAAVGMYTNMNEALSAPAPSPAAMTANKGRGSPHGTIGGAEDASDYSAVPPHHWQMRGDERFFHLSAQPQRRLRRAADVADAHHVEGQTDVLRRLEEGEGSYYAAREARRRRLIADRRRGGRPTSDNDTLSEMSEYSDANASDTTGRATAPVAILEGPNGTKIFRAFASPHKDPYLNML